MRLGFVSMLRFMLPAAGREISEEEGDNSVIPSSTNVALRFAGRAVRKKKTG